MEALMAGAGGGANFKMKVTSYASQGGRPHMEDMISVAYQPTADGKDLLYAYFGIFDGHGGKDAARYAKEHLRDNIVSQKDFWAEDDEAVLRAIRNGFNRTHQAMWKDQGNWPTTSKGLPSTAGTTASIGFIRRGKLFTGHVGDSRIVSGYQNPGQKYWCPKRLTKDHKPDCEEEMWRITESGGEVSDKSGVLRVVWNRTLNSDHQGPIRRSTPMTKISFLAMTRSLGDFWSYNPELGRFIVSPAPDVSVEEINVNSQRCFIFATDGLWDALSPQDAVNSVWHTENPQEAELGTSFEEENMLTDPSERFVSRALQKWEDYRRVADNTSVVTVVIKAAGAPKAHVSCQNLKKRSLNTNTSSLMQMQNKSAPTTASAMGDQLQIVKNPVSRREVKKALALKRSTGSTGDVSHRRKHNSKRGLEPSISSDFSIPHSFTELPCLSLAVITPNSTSATVEYAHRGEHYESAQVVLESGKRKRSQSPAKAVVELDKPMRKIGRQQSRACISSVPSVESEGVDEVPAELESGKGRSDRPSPRTLQLTKDAKEKVRPRISSATFASLNGGKTETANVGKMISSSTKPSSDVTTLRRSIRATRGKSTYYAANED